MEFTTAISNLPFVKALEAEEQGRLYAKFTNIVYQQLQDVEMTAKEYKQKHGIAKKEIAKHYFKKDGLLDLEKIETKLATIIDFTKPDSVNNLKKLFNQFFSTLSE